LGKQALQLNLQEGSKLELLPTKQIQEYHSSHFSKENTMF